jgi:septum formation protein
VLASASPRRADLLAAAGFRFDVHPVGIDERPRTAELPEAYVLRLASEKSAAAVRRWPDMDDRVVIGADTAVVLDGQILGKPCDANEMRSMLLRLSDRRHEVLTGLSLRRGARELGHVERTAVFFAPIGDADIDWYVKSGEGMDKAGAYAIQGLAARFVTRIEGSYSNVVGLPVSAVYALLTTLVQAGDPPGPLVLS